MKENNLHIGKLVQDFVKQNNINSAQLAREIGKTRQNIYDLYKRDDVEVKLLLTISKALKHNFFEDIYPAATKETSVDEVFDVLKKLVEERI